MTINTTPYLGHHCACWCLSSKQYQVVCRLNFDCLIVLRFLSLWLNLDFFFSIRGHGVKWSVTPDNMPPYFNSSAPGKFQRNLGKVIFQLILMIDGWSISCKIVLKWMQMDLTDGKSTLVQVMAWCRQATIHYLSQYWPRSLSPYGIIRPRWVKRQ